MDTLNLFKKTSETTYFNRDFDFDIMSDAEVARMGREYSLMICPWMENTVFNNLNGRPNVDLTSDDRYTDKTAIRNGTIAELYDFVPATLHEAMESEKHFATIVCASDL